MEGDVERLEAHLRSLKRRGANVLLLTDPSDVTVCRQLLGSESMLRRRLLVRTHGNERTVPEADPDRFGLIDVSDSKTRTTLTESLDGTELPSGTHPVEPQTPHGNPAASPDDGAPNWFSRPSPATSLSTLARHVHDHLTRFEAEEPAPGEIRVCFDSLDTLFDDVPTPQLHRFLHVVTARVRTARAIGHYHLSAAAGGDPGDVERLFDATVETRPAVDGPQQRWTLHGPEIRTDWLRLE